MKLMAAIVLLVVPLQASEWAIGVDVFYPQLASLWRTGEQWGVGLALGGPTIGKNEEETTADVSAAFSVQRFKGRSFFFAETGWEYFREKWFEVVSDHSYGLRIGMGISRKYKDFGVFISHGFELELEENDENRSWDAGLMRYPRVVAYWTL